MLYVILLRVRNHFHSRPILYHNLEASLPKLNVYGKEQHPQGNHLHQRQGEDTIRSLQEQMLLKMA